MQPKILDPRAICVCLIILDGEKHEHAGTCKRM